MRLPARNPRLKSLLLGEAFPEYLPLSRDSSIAVDICMPGSMIAAHRFKLSEISKDRGETRKEEKITSKRNVSKDGSDNNQSVVPLEDLAPRRDPKGGKAGSGKTVFGGGPVISGSYGEDRRGKK